MARHAAKYGVKQTFADWREMLAKVPLDAVSVCTPNKLHAECAIGAMEAGCAVLCEKPLAGSAAEGEQMIAAAERLRPQTRHRLPVSVQLAHAVPEECRRRRSVRPHPVRARAGAAPPRHPELGCVRPQGTARRRSADRHRRARAGNVPLHARLADARERQRRHVHVHRQSAVGPRAVAVEGLGLRDLQRRRSRGRPRPLRRTARSCTSRPASPPTSRRTTGAFS